MKRISFNKENCHTKLHLHIYRMMEINVTQKDVQLDVTEFMRLRLPLEGTA